MRGVSEADSTSRRCVDINPEILGLAGPSPGPAVVVVVVRQGATETELSVLAPAWELIGIPHTREGDHPKLTSSGQVQ